MKKTVKQFVDLLISTKSEIDLKHIQYSRISRKAVALPAELTKEEQAKVTQAVTAAASTQAMQAALQAGEKLISEKQAIHFEWAKDRYPVASLTENETRDNLSLRVKITGTLELPESRPSTLPHFFGTAEWRNYCLIKDGEWNISVLPVFLTHTAHSTLTEWGVTLPPYLEGMVYEISMDQFEKAQTPTSMKIESFAEAEMTILTCKALKKAIKAVEEEISPREPSKIMEQAYGAEAAEWLQSIGVTDQGYAPKSELKQPTSHYEAEELNVKIKGVAIPSVNALRKKQAEGKKINAGDLVLATALTQAQTAVAGIPEQAAKLKALADMSKVNTDLLCEATETVSQFKSAILTQGLWFDGLTKGEPATTQFGEAKIEISVSKTLIPM